MGPERACWGVIWKERGWKKLVKGEEIIDGGGDAGEEKVKIAIEDESGEKEVVIAIEEARDGCLKTLTRLRL